MPRGKRYQPEQVVNLLPSRSGGSERQDDGAGVQRSGDREQTYFRWRKEYGGLQIDQAKRLKEREQENSKLKCLVANLGLDNLMLKYIASGNF